MKRWGLISAVVGTILVLINKRPAFFLAPQANLYPLARVVLNYMVPFPVATIRAMMAKSRSPLRNPPEEPPRLE